MHAVSNAINILDPALVIDKKICKAHDKNNSAADKCGLSKVSSSPVSSTDGVGLSAWFGSEKGAGQANGAYKDESQKMEKWGEHNSRVVSRDTTSNLTREEKGVVSSVFAKVIEGAEILEGSLGNIDVKICKDKNSNKCKKASDDNDLSSGWTLSEVFKDAYTSKATDRLIAHNSKVVSDDTAALSSGDI